MATAYSKPKFIRELEASLKELEGMSFENEVRVFDHGLDLDVNVTRIPSNYCENILRAVVESIRPESLRSTTVEPNGGRSFPDLRLDFTNCYDYIFESKSWLSTYCAWQAASVSKFQDSLAQKDDKYLRAWFVDFSLIQQKDSVKIHQIQIGRMWDFCDGRARTGQGKVGLVARDSGSPEELIWNGSDHNEHLYNNGIDMLEDLGVTCDRNAYGMQHTAV